MPDQGRAGKRPFRVSRFLAMATAALALMVTGSVLTNWWLFGVGFAIHAWAHMVNDRKVKR